MQTSIKGHLGYLHVLAIIKNAWRMLSQSLATDWIEGVRKIEDDTEIASDIVNIRKMLVMGFRTRYPKVCHWNTEYLKLKEVEKWQKQEKHSDLLPCLSSLKQVLKLPCDRSPPSVNRKEDILITRDREFVAKKFVKNKSC